VEGVVFVSDGDKEPSDVIVGVGGIVSIGKPVILRGTVGGIVDGGIEGNLVSMGRGKEGSIVEGGIEGNLVSVGRGKVGSIVEGEIEGNLVCINRERGVGCTVEGEVVGNLVCVGRGKSEGKSGLYTSIGLVGLSVGTLGLLGDDVVAIGDLVSGCVVGSDN